MIYLDSSALVKLVVEEAESLPLRQWLAQQPDSRVSSILARVEVRRAVARVAPAGEAAASTAQAARDLVSRLDLLWLGPEVLDLAASLGPSSMRSLDAIHLASAALLRDELTAFVAYDARLLEAAAGLRLPVVRPAGSG